MLKWLFRRSHNPSLGDIITDDPLATLHFSTTSGSHDLKPGNNNQGFREIYSVSRTNPLYACDGVGKFDRDIFHKYFPKDSSRSAGSSSSGYSSQKQEQDDHEVDEQQASDPSSFVRPVLTARSSGLEIDMEPDQQTKKEIRKSVPDPVWPSIPSTEMEKKLPPETGGPNSLSLSLFSQTKSQSVLENFGNSGKNRLTGRRHGAQYQPGKEMSPIGECPSFDETDEVSRAIETINDDSIVTDDLLKMTDKCSSMTSHSDDFANRDLDSLQESPRRNEDMDKVIQELTVAVMKSRNVTSLTRALRSKKVDPKGSQSSELSAIASGSLSKRKHNLRGSYRSTKKISRGSVSGVSLMRDLWKQTGMKTNGRKLLADGHDEDVLTMEEVGVRKTKRPKKKEGERSSRDASPDSGSPKLSTTSSATQMSSSEFSAPYVETREKNPLTYSSSTEVYAEVYQEDSKKPTASAPKPAKKKTAGSHRIIRNDVTVDLDEIEVGTSTTCYTTSSSSSSLSSGRKSSEKRVQFRPDVLDNETSGDKLIYDRILRAGLPNPHGPYLVDVGRSNRCRYNHPNSAWETFYGATENMSGPSSKTSSQNLEDSYKYIFSSPYFDYRKTHSRVGSTIGCSDLQLEQPRSNLIQQRYIQRKDVERKRFWKLFAIVLGIGLVVVVIVALTIYIIFGKSVLVTSN